MNSTALLAQGCFLVFMCGAQGRKSVADNEGSKALAKVVKERGA
jgi:hypothetical protein